MGPHPPHPMVVGAGLGLRFRRSNQSELAKCASDGASHSLILVFKGSCEGTTISCGRFLLGIASLHGEAKKPIAKNRAGNGINEMHINQIFISNLILSLENPLVKLVRVS